METIEILGKLYPSFRAVCDMPNFNHSNLTEFTFLIASKAETFELLIDSVELVQ